jgi:putative hydrolase of the HAD superfamily
MSTNIVFDFGAVLFTWQPHLLVQAHFPSAAATPDAARQLAADIFHHDDWQAFDGGTLDLPVVSERTARRLGLPHETVYGLMSRIPEHLLPIPETVALLARLNERRDRQGDIRLYFLSNMPVPFARALEQRHGFLKCFDGGLFSGDARLIKPQPEIFQLLQSRYALDPTQTVFIDDLLANVQAARAHGWRGIHFESATLLDTHLKTLT